MTESRLSRERYERGRSLFDRALRFDPSQRTEWLRSTCGDDHELFSWVARLLANDAHTTELLSEQALSGGGSPWASLRLGSYRLVEKIGSGGSGVVFRACREDGEYTKEVAIKFLPFGFADSVEERRFRSERQIVALLEHPNICRLLDSGTSSDGIPYLVMELVDGIPITDYCDSHELTIEQRLRLFIDVCEAVQFAHQQFVVHRDLKPGNILVTGDGIAKLLDFGIAKLLDDQKTEPTRTEHRMLTPGFASPEHLQGDRITTASDVFSLGSLLYVLLTGLPPWNKWELDEASSSMTRLVDEHSLIPSRAFEASSDGQAALRFRAERRGHASASSLGRRLRGDLDAIVAKAVQVHPQDRYQTVDQLANDLRRHLQSLPVSARHSSSHYVMKRFVRRHRRELAAVVVTASCVVGFLSFHTLRVRNERAKAGAQQQLAAEATDFLVKAFELASPQAAQTIDPTARDIMAIGEARLGELASEPSLQNLLRHTMGTAYLGLGDFDRAHQLLTSAAKWRRQNGPGGDLARTLVSLGRLSFLTGRFDDSESHLEEALATFTSVGADDTELAALLGYLARTHHIQSRPLEAEALFADALEILASSHEPGPVLTDVVTAYAYLLLSQGKPDLAEAKLSDLLAIYRQESRPRNPRLAKTYTLLGHALFDQGDLLAARERYQQAFELYQSVYGEGSLRAADSLADLAFVSKSVGDHREALEQSERALQAYDQLAEPHHLNLAPIRTTLALVLADLGELERAEMQLREAHQILSVRLTPDHFKFVTTHCYLGRVLSWQGNVQPAEEHLERALAIVRESFDEPHPAEGEILATLAHTLYVDGRYDEALEICRRIRQREEGSSARSSLQNLARADSIASAVLVDVGRFEEARVHGSRSLTLSREVFGDHHWQTQLARARLGSSLIHLGETERALELFEVAHHQLAGALGSNSPHTREVAERRSNVRRWS